MIQLQRDGKGQVRVVRVRVENDLLLFFSVDVAQQNKRMWPSRTVQWLRSSTRCPVTVEQQSSVVSRHTNRAKISPSRSSIHSGWTSWSQPGLPVQVNGTVPPLSFGASDTQTTVINDRGDATQSPGELIGGISHHKKFVRQ